MQLFEFVFQEDKNNRNVAVFQSNPLMNGLSPSDYVLSAFSNVHTNDLEQTLLVCLRIAFLLLDLMHEYKAFQATAFRPIPFFVVNMLILLLNHCLGYVLAY